jgi:ribonuclease Y
MFTPIILSTVSAVVAAIISYFIAKKINDANYEIYTEQAKAKAKAIEHEAELVLKNAKIEVKEAQLDAKRQVDAEYAELKNSYDEQFNRLESKERELNRKLTEELEQLKLDRSKVASEQAYLHDLSKRLTSQKESYDQKATELIKQSESLSGLTQEEAKTMMLQLLEEQSREEKAHIVRKAENEAREEAKRKADYILAQATTRFAGEFAAERLVNVVQLPNDELKGRIIGKEGRNIKLLEMLLGVDIIIDDTPNTILLSSFNLYRRAIATTTIEKLVEDGRIQPARIEDIYHTTVEEFEEQILRDGEDVVLDLGIKPLHPELTKLVGKMRYRASYGQNALGHSLEVANLAGIIAGELGGDVKLAKRAGLLHDIGKALTQESTSNDHVELGAEICKRYNEHEVVINAIYAHHGHEESNSVESAAVCTADSLSAARPGARREVLESFLKRVEEIEEIAGSKYGVRQAYAINAGREIRIILNAELVNDDESVLLAKEIATEIEEKVQYPGEIKVNVIRELRAISFAK